MLQGSFVFNSTSIPTQLLIQVFYNETWNWTLVTVNRCVLIMSPFIKDRPLCMDAPSQQLWYLTTSNSTVLLLFWYCIVASIEFMCLHLFCLLPVVCNYLCLSSFTEINTVSFYFLYVLRKHSPHWFTKFCHHHQGRQKRQRFRRLSTCYHIQLLLLGDHVANLISSSCF